MKSFYLTDAGKVRNHNEDSVIIVKNNDGEYLMAIADGMGGHSAGEVASSIAIGYLGKHFKETFLHLNKVRITGIFEDSSKASELSCDSNDNNCDLLDRTFPLEEALIPVMLQYIIKELGGVNYRPADKLNNANDDLSTMMNFIRNNMKNDFQKEISTAIDGIRKDSIHIASDYRNFIAIYEAIVAYHKFYGGKDN